VGKQDAGDMRWRRGNDGLYMRKARRFPLLDNTTFVRSRKFSSDFMSLELWCHALRGCVTIDQS